MTPTLVRRMAAAAAAAVVVSTTLAACGSSSGSGSDDGGPKVGLIAAEQGPFAFAGTSYLQGAELAAELEDIELVVEEGSEDPAKSITAFNKLTSDDVSAVICCISSSVAGAMKPLAAQKEVPLVVYGATTPGLEEPPYVLRPALLPQQGIAPVATQLVEELDITSAVHVTASDNDGLVAQSETAVEATEAAGAENLGTVTTLVADTDFSGAVTDILSKDADMVTIYTLGEAAANITKSLREQGYEGVILANNAVATGPLLESFGATLADTYYSVEYTPASEIPEAQEFTEAYEDKYGEKPDVFASQGYVAVKYVAKGIEDASEPTDAASVAEALTAIEELESPWGPLVFEGGQGTSENFQVVQIDDQGVPQLWTGQ